MSDKVRVRPIRINVLLTLDRINLDWSMSTVAATSLPHRCHVRWSGLLQAGWGAHTLAEGRMCLHKGRIQKTVGCIRLSEGRICLSEGRIRLAEGCIRLSKGRIRLAEGRKRQWPPPPRPFVPPRECSHPPLYRVRPLYILDMLAWKSTSPSNVPCQPIVLTRDKI
jgi:hypothetical protein